MSKSTNRRWHLTAMLQTDGTLSLEELWQALHELGETVMENCDGKWVLTRKDIAERCHKYAEHLARAPWARKEIA